VASSADGLRQYPPARLPAVCPDTFERACRVNFREPDGHATEIEYSYYSEIFPVAEAAVILKHGQHM